MSVVLIVDEKSERIKDQFIPMKGIICDTAINLEDAKKLIGKEQYDYIIVDFNLVLSTKNEFLEYCRETQPSVSFHYIVTYSTNAINGGLPDEVNLADTYLKRPVSGDNINDLIGGENLVEQSDIDALFKRARK